MASGTLITDYLSYGSGAPSGAPSLATGSQYGLYQDTATGNLWLWDLDHSAWRQVAVLTSSGYVPLAELSGITTTQLSATAGIVAGQITSVNPSALTGSGTVPPAGLPLASSSAFGAVKVDGTTITAASGVISAAAGGSLAGAENTYTGTNLTTTSSTFVDVKSTLDITITTGAHRVLIGLVGSCAAAGSGGPDLYFDIQIDGTGSGASNGLTQINSTGDNILSLWWLSPVLTAASHTFKAVWKVGSGVTGTMFVSGDGLYCRFMAIETALTT